MMNHASPDNLRSGFCIYVDTVFQGPVAVLSDGESYVIFSTELEAQREIVDHQMARLQEFLDGEREFEDAMTIEEYVVPVMIHPDGVITDGNDNCFGPGVVDR